MSIDMDTTKIALSPRTFITLISSVIITVSAYFVASERVNSHIDDTNKRIDNLMMLFESQQNLIISNRYKDSIEIDYLNRRFRK